MVQPGSFSIQFDNPTGSGRLTFAEICIAGEITGGNCGGGGPEPAAWCLNDPCVGVGVGFGKLGGVSAGVAPQLWGREDHGTPGQVK